MQKDITEHIKIIKNNLDKFNNSWTSNDDEICKIIKQQKKSLLNKLSDMIVDYQEVNLLYKTEKKNTIIRMVKIKNFDKNLSEEQLETIAQEIIQTDSASTIFQNSKDKLHTIMENRNDVVKIEQSMRELNQMFMDLSLLINEQEEGIHNITHNVENSNKSMIKGHDELQEAKKYQKKSSKKICYIIGLLFVIFLFILAIVLGTILGK
jgi:t-SNARE complex subunit (syntaxin)